MLGQNYVTLESAVSGFEGFKAKVEGFQFSRFTAAEKTQLASKISKQKSQLAKAFSDQLGFVNNRLSAAEREHKVKTTPSSTDFAYIQLLAGKNQTQLLDLAKSSTTAARLLAAEPGLFGLSPELANSMSKAASPETYKNIEDLDVEAVRLEQLQESAMKEVNQWSMKYETNADTQAQADFLGDSGDSGGEL
jgi:hypothetical protein